MKAKRADLLILASLPVFFLFNSCKTSNPRPVLDQQKLAKEYFGNDAQWYIDNIPFFECSDKQIEQVYYYRWKMYKAHIRNVGDNRYVITEFINHVSWDRDPYCTINAASMHHIYEGRWLKDPRYIESYINYLYQDGGNNRHYSESIADAAYASYLVNADSGFIKKQLDSMVYFYNQWYDHWDSSKNLFYIPAMPDATEYNIAAIDASGGKDGFAGGDAFRPTINSYMYGNAMAISKIAMMSGDTATANEFSKRARSLQFHVTHDLWNEKMQHFMDRYKQDNQYVHYWDFIRGRELAGMAPWYFDLPADNKIFSNEWKHIIDTNNLLGQYGLRTNEPSYQYYFTQFLYYLGQRGSQWNGPSWPYQTSMALTGMANVLNDYHQDVITDSDYVKILRLFTQQHYLPDGKIDLVENYDPNLGGPIVYYYWSNHYNHSSYNNLIISGLCGIRPSESDTLTINPLVDSSISYFYLDDVRYHGHKLTVVYDHDGSKYKIGKGITVFVDDKKATIIKQGDKTNVYIGPPLVPATKLLPVNLALNINHSGYPLPSASVNAEPDTSLYQAIDGRVWYFPEITNRWTSIGSGSDTDWYAVDFVKEENISSVKLYFVTDDLQLAVPDSIGIDYKINDQWLPVKNIKFPAHVVGNTGNSFSFENVSTRGIKINFLHKNKQVAISELECY